LITEQTLVDKVARLAHRLDTDPPQVRIVKDNWRDPLAVRYMGNVLKVTEKALEELSESELDFGLALSFAKRIRPSFEGTALALGPFLTLTGVGVSSLILGKNYFVHHFYFGVFVMFVLLMLGYVIGASILHTYRVKHRSDVYHEALMQTGNASAAETYLIRCQTDHIVGSRRKLSGKDRENLDTHLTALRDAARRLGIAHRQVVAKFEHA
jgi:hypothetical protein